MHAFQIKCYQVYLQNVPYCNQALTYSISHSWTDLLLKICLKIFEAAFAYWNSLWVYHLIAFACTLVCEKQSWAELGLMMVISWWLALDGGLLRNCVSSPQWCRDDWLHPRCCHGDVLCVCIALIEAVRWYELFRGQHSGPPAPEGEKRITWLWAWITCGWSSGLFYTRWENHCRDKLTTLTVLFIMNTCTRAHSCIIQSCHSSALH